MRLRPGYRFPKPSKPLSFGRRVYLNISLGVAVVSSLTWFATRVGLAPTPSGREPASLPSRSAQAPNPRLAQAFNARLKWMQLRQESSSKNIYWIQSSDLPDQSELGRVVNEALTENPGWGEMVMSRSDGHLLSSPLEEAEFKKMLGSRLEIALKGHTILVTTVRR